MRKISKKTVVRIIRHDLNILKIVWSLHHLGFKGDESNLSNSWLIFAMMNLNTNDSNNSHIQDQYSDKAYRVMEIAANDSEAMNDLSEEIYNWLSKERRKYKKERLI